MIIATGWWTKVLLILMETAQADCIDLDDDNDGVLDVQDNCPNTVSGSIVDASGCAISQICPCEGPVTGQTWPSHGNYVACVDQTSKKFFKAGLITTQRESSPCKTGRKVKLRQVER